MNWLAEYFARRMSPLMMSLWAHPPFVIGPDGPVPQGAYALPYPGVELVFSPGIVLSHEGRSYPLPPRYDTVGPLSTSIAGERLFDKHDESFFKQISIYAPSPFNPDFLVTVNDAFSFVPTFAQDGSPAFLGLAMAPSSTDGRDSNAKLPWTFQGYISI